MNFHYYLLNIVRDNLINKNYMMNSFINLMKYQQKFTI